MPPVEGSRKSREEKEREIETLKEHFDFLCQARENKEFLQRVRKSCETEKTIREDGKKTIPEDRYIPYQNTTDAGQDLDQIEECRQKILDYYWKPRYG
jgi:hypothetical protein